MIDFGGNRTDNIINTEFNNTLRYSLMLNNVCDWEPTYGLQYTTFNELILQTAHQIATKPKFENKG